MIEFLMWCLGFRWCNYCEGYYRSVKRRRNPTAYVDDRLNLSVSCHACWLDTCEYWEEMWAEHRRGQL
jgi:hypothetical protein